MTANATNFQRMVFVNEYVEMFLDDWNCKFDNEDGSTAPFSALVAEAVSVRLED